MTKQEIIDKYGQHDPAYLCNTLTAVDHGTNILSCDDVRQNYPKISDCPYNTCCETCHEFYHVYEMSLTRHPDGNWWFVCDHVRWQYLA